MAGNDENFLISGCHFGSLWGLYHYDIEPNTNLFVRDGVFLNCDFEGDHAGEMNTDTWGAMFMFSGEGQLKNRNISVIGCTFNKINIRVRGIFPDVQFLYNPQLGKIVKLRGNNSGEFRDATIRDNTFGTPDDPMKKISSSVAFTGNTVFEGNIPPSANDTKITAESKDGHWVEEHPTAQKPVATDAKPEKLDIKIDPKDGKVVTVPLMGHQFNFVTGAILNNREAGAADVIFHGDPLMAIGKAGIKVLSAAELKAGDDSLPKLSKLHYESFLWAVQPGDTVAARTNSGQYVVMKILDEEKTNYTIQYRFVK